MEGRKPSFCCGSSVADALPMVESGAKGVSEVEAYRFRSFSDAMPYGVCPVDLTGKIIHCNCVGGGDYQLFVFRSARLKR